jgi:hypothetical protein
MNTKQYVWQFFNSTLRVLAQEECASIDYEDMCILLKNYANIYDNRSLKNYIDCLINNKWVIEDNDTNPLNPHGLITNPESPIYMKSSNCITMYKHTKFLINKEAEYEKIDPNEVLNQILKRNKPKTKTTPTAPNEPKEERFAPTPLIKK